MDRELVKVYLSDHVAGATAALGRVERMAEAYQGSELGSAAHELAPQLREERGWIVALAERHHAGPSRWKSVLTSVGEHLGRLKPNARVVHTSPVTPLLELELLAGGLRGKQSGWRTLRAWADDLDLDVDELDGFLERVEEQIATVDRVSVGVRERAFGR